MNARPLPRLLVLAVTAAIAAPALAQSRGDNPLLLELLDRVDQLERETRQMRGDLEVLRYQLDEAQRHAQGVAPAAPAAAVPAPAAVNSAPPPARPAAGAGVPVAAGAQEAYDAAVNLLRDGHYEQATAALLDFLRHYPTGSLAASAQYWLGESYYVSRDYTRARDAFVQFGASNPNHEKVPEALLKLGYCYAELGDTAKARDVLRRLTQAYPNSAAAGQADKRLQQLP